MNEHVDLEARELQALAALQRVVGLVALVGAEPGERHVAHDVREHGALDLAHVDGRAGRARNGRHGPDVIEVAVGEQHGLDLEAQLVDRTQDPVGLLAGVHHHRALGAIEARDEAVLGHGADREHPHVHREECISAARVPSFAGGGGT